MAAPDLPSLIRAELAGHAWWVIYLRYGCAAAVILCTMIVTQNMGAKLEAAPLYGIAGALVAANLLYGIHLSSTAQRMGVVSSVMAARSLGPANRGGPVSPDPTPAFLGRGDESTHGVVHRADPPVRVPALRAGHVRVRRTGDGPVCRHGRAGVPPGHSPRPCSRPLSPDGLSQCVVPGGSCGRVSAGDQPGGDPQSSGQRPIARVPSMMAAAVLWGLTVAAQPGDVGPSSPTAPLVEERLEAVRKAPTDPRARLQLGVAYAQAEEYDLAMAELVETINLNPENRDNLSARANYHLGLVLLAIDRAGLALNAFREALRLGWKDAAVYLALGQALTGQGKFEEAIAQYDEALRLAPGAIEAHAGLGLALEGSGRVDEAIAQYELYLQSASGADQHSVEAIAQRLEKLKERRKM